MPVPLPLGIDSHMPIEVSLSRHSCIHAGERSVGISHLHVCEGKSYSAPLILQPDASVRTVHCNARHPSLPKGDQDVIYLMSCSPLSAPEDLKVLIREGISKLCPPELIHSSYYEALRFFLAPGESVTTGLYLLVGLQLAFEVHMRLRDAFLCQPDFISKKSVTNLPWLEPPFAVPSDPFGQGNPPNQSTLGEIAYLLKGRFRPAPIGGKNPKDFRWVTRKKKRKKSLTRGHVKDIGSAWGIQSYRGQGYEGAISGKCFCDFPVPLSLCDSCALRGACCARPMSVGG
jgi:hypothetical protein